MSALEDAGEMTSTNDHIVPRMYLRRFGIERSGGPQVCAASIDAMEKDFMVGTRNVGAERSFYWGSGPDGVPTHDMEVFLTSVDVEAATAFRRIVDKGKRPTDNAFPDRWPPTADTRVAIAWWTAAQLIRTAPQRDVSGAFTEMIYSSHPGRSGEQISTTRTSCRRSLPLLVSFTPARGGSASPAFAY